MHRPLRQRWRSRRSRATTRWCSWPSSLTSIPTRYRPGRITARRGHGDFCDELQRQAVDPRGRHQGAAREDRRTNAGERFFRKCARQGGIAERKAMIDRDHDLPLTRQAAVLNISRGTLYYKPRPASAADLALMRRMDELHL